MTDPIQQALMFARADARVLNAGLALMGKGTPPNAAILRHLERVTARLAEGTRLLRELHFDVELQPQSPRIGGVYKAVTTD